MRDMTSRTPSTVRLLIAAALLVLVAPACRTKRTTPVARGEGIFLRSCAGCHGPDARGTHPPGFVTPPRDLTDPTLQERLSDAAIEETIHYGKGQMPPFGAALTPEDLKDLVAYVRTL